VQSGPQGQVHLVVMVSFPFRPFVAATHADGRTRKVLHPKFKGHGRSHAL
jgi:hypothetical protein